MPVMRQWALIGSYVIRAVMFPLGQECHAALSNRHAITEINAMDDRRIELISVSTCSPNKQYHLTSSGLMPIRVVNPNMASLDFDTRPNRTSGYKIDRVIEVFPHFAVWRENHISTGHNIVGCSAPAILPRDAQQYRSDLGSDHYGRHKNLRPSQLLLDGGLKSYDLLLISANGGKLVGRPLQPQRKDSYRDGGQGSENPVVVINEMSRSEYERHVTSGWLFFGGLFLLLVYVIWDWLDKR